MGLFGKNNSNQQPLYEASDFLGDIDPRTVNNEMREGKYTYDDIERLLMRVKFRARFTMGDAFVFINDLRMIYSENDMHELLKYNGAVSDKRHLGLYSEGDLEVLKIAFQGRLSTVAAADRFLALYRDAIEIAWLEGVGSHDKEVQVLIEALQRYNRAIETTAVSSIKILSNGPTQPVAGSVRTIMGEWKADAEKTINKLEALKGLNNGA